MDDKIGLTDGLEDDAHESTPQAPTQGGWPIPAGFPNLLLPTPALQHLHGPPGSPGLGLAAPWEESTGPLLSVFPRKQGWLS